MAINEPRRTLNGLFVMQTGSRFYDSVMLVYLEEIEQADATAYRQEFGGLKGCDDLCSLLRRSQSAGGDVVLAVKNT